MLAPWTIEEARELLRRAMTEAVAVAERAFSEEDE